MLPIFDQLTQYFKKYKKVAGLEILIKPDQSYVYHLVILERKKNKIEIVDRFLNLDSIAAISKIEGITTLPIAAVLNGKSILNKKIAGTNLSDNQSVSTVIPNASPEEFTFELFDATNHTWISIVRKELLENILKEFSTAGLNIVDLSLGVFVVQQILPLIETPGHVDTTGYRLTIEDDKIAEVSMVETPGDNHYKIGEDKINSSLVVAFSKAFSKLLGVSKKLNNATIVSTQEENFIYTTLFQKLKWGGLIGIFGLLLINFLLFSYLNNKNQKNGVRLSMHQNQLNELNHLKKQYQEKQIFIKQTSVLKSSKTSWYADQIAASLEEGIELQQLEIAPSLNKKKRRIDQQYLFDHKKIMIKGTSQKSIYLNRWIKDLQNLDWIESIEVLPYSEKEKGRGVFELEVILKEEQQI